nr:DNA-directed DNA polymerase [Tanacetum cinerariifolium]
MKQNGVTYDTLRLFLFPYSLTHHATAWFDRLPKNSIHTFDEMVSKFLFKYFPPSMVKKLRNDINNFQQLPHESLFKASERYKLSIDRCPNHNMLTVTQIDISITDEILRQHMIASDAKFQLLVNQMTKIEKALNERPQGALPSNTIPNPKEDIKVITTRSGITLAGPSVPPPDPSFSSSKEVERDPETTMDQVHISSPKSTTRVPSLVVQPSLASKPNEIPERNPHQPPIPYPSSFAEALAQMPKYVRMLKDLLTNKEKLLELDNTPLNENYSAVLLKKLPEKLGDPRKFLNPCDFSELEECMVLPDLGVSINLMPLSVFKKLMLPELVPTRMTLELASRSIFYPAGKPFLRTARTLVDVYGEELTLRVDDEKLIFNVERISKYPQKHGDESINQIDINDTTCEDYYHEVLNVQKSIHPLSGSPTPSDPVVASLFPSLTPFGDSDSLLEETNALLGLDDSIPPEIDNGIFNAERDILFLEKLLNYDSTKDLPPKELKIDETKTTKSLIKEPPELELKDLPPHPEYTFLEGTSKLPVIIAIDLKKEEKDQLIKVLKSHKRAIAWKISDIRGIDPNFFTHKILMEDNFKPTVQHQRMKGGMTVVTTNNNELISTRLVTGWRVCIDYQNLNHTTRKDYFSLLFMDQMLERLAGNEFYCFLDGFSGYFQIPIDLQDQEKTTFTCPYGTFSYRRMPFGLCNASRTFERCTVAIFHDMIEKTMEVFMDDFSVFGDSFSSYLSHLDMMLKRFIQDFSKIAHPMTHLLEKETPFVFSKECMESFEYLKKKLTEAPILVAPDWDLPFEIMCDASGVLMGRKLWIFLKLATMVPSGDIMARTTPPRKFLILVSFGPLYIMMPMTWSHTVTHINVKEKSHKGTKFPRIISRIVRSLTYEASTLWGHSRLHEGTSIYSWLSIMFSKALPINDARVVVKFLNQLFSRFGTPRAIISNRGSYAEKLVIYPLSSSTKPTGP